jgi:hypothetical protein
LIHAGHTERAGEIHCALSFDESKVKEYELTAFDKFYNKQYSYKYPKAGEAN